MAAPSDSTSEHKVNLSSSIEVAIAHHESGRYEEAKMILETDSDGDSAKKLMMLAALLLDRPELSKGEYDAYELVKKSIAINENGYAWYILGVIYTHTKKHPHHKSIFKTKLYAFRAFKQSLELGEFRAHLALADIYRLGKVTDRDIDKALYHYEQAALNGVPEAQFVAGLIYGGAEGFTPSYLKAEYWICASASGGYSIAIDFSRSRELCDTASVAPVQKSRSSTQKMPRTSDPKTSTHPDLSSRIIGGVFDVVGAALTQKVVDKIAYKGFGVKSEKQLHNQRLKEMRKASYDGMRKALRKDRIKKQIQNNLKIRY
jgi:TPR repeat protein